MTINTPFFLRLPGRVLAWQNLFAGSDLKILFAEKNSPPCKKDYLIFRVPCTISPPLGKFYRRRTIFIKKTFRTLLLLIWMDRFFYVIRTIRILLGVFPTLLTVLIYVNNDSCGLSFSAIMWHASKHMRSAKWKSTVIIFVRFLWYRRN